MKTLRALGIGLLVGLLCTAVSGQVSAPSTLDVREEGTSQGRVRTLNFVGSTVTAAVSGGVGTITITGGSGSANVVEKSIDLGTEMGLVYRATVTGEAWVTTSSEIVCSMFGTTADGQTIETYEAAGLVVLASNRVAATGFDISIYNPNGATGIFRVHCTGA